VLPSTTHSFAIIFFLFFPSIPNICIYHIVLPGEFPAFLGVVSGGLGGEFLLKMKQRGKYGHEYSFSFFFFFLFSLSYTKPTACMVCSPSLLFFCVFLFFFSFLEEFCYNESYELPDGGGFRLRVQVNMGFDITRQ